MAYTDINNPPFPPKGKITVWNGTEWVFEDESKPIPPMPKTSGNWDWNGSEWIDVLPPAPTPDGITSGTITKAVFNLQTIAYLTTGEMGQHITPESRQEVTDYIHAVANILAIAQTKYGTGEAYEPVFPPMPTAIPQLLSAARSGEPELVRPFIQFIEVN